MEKITPTTPVYCWNFLDAKAEKLEASQIWQAAIFNHIDRKDELRMEFSESFGLWFLTDATGMRTFYESEDFAKVFEKFHAYKKEPCDSFGYWSTDKADCLAYISEVVEDFPAEMRFKTMLAEAEAL